MHRLGCSAQELTFANLANVQTVGIGLYLALGIVQVVSAGGVSSLRRRAAALHAAVIAARLVAEYKTTRGIIAEIGRTEIRFDALNRAILLIVSALFLISVFYFAYCTLFQNYKAEVKGTVFILLYYLALPILIFTASGLVIGRRCKAVRQKIQIAEARFLKM